MDSGCIEMNASECHLHDGPGSKGTDQGSSSNRASQKISDQGSQTEQGNAHSTDRQAFHPLSQADQQSIPWPAA